jgi:hypothetical protein
VSVFIVPASTAARPTPSLELRRVVSERLLAHAPAEISSRQRLYVAPPSYAEVTVRAVVVVRSMRDSAAAERLAGERLRAFLHPLSGGPDGLGWDFGQGLAVSSLFMLLEDIPEIDHVKELSIDYDGAPAGDYIALEPDQLLAAKEFEISIEVAGKDS